MKYLLLIIVLVLGAGCASAPPLSIHSTFVSKPASLVVATDPVEVTDTLTATASASIDLDTLAPAFRIQIDLKTPQAALACSVVRLTIPNGSSDVTPEVVPGTGRIVFGVNREELGSLIGLNVCGEVIDLDAFRAVADQFLDIVDAIRGAIL